MKKTRQRKVWQAHEDDLLRACYPCSANVALIKVLGCSLDMLYYRASYLGVKKSKWFSKRHPSSGSLAMNPDRGLPGRFIKGQATWNKGLHYQAGGRSAETQFKKGQVPKNTMQIGDYRQTSRDKYWQVKMTHTGITRFDFVFVHRLIWERCNGRPVPKGHLIRFRDGNHDNLDISNLECVSKGEHIKQNGYHYHPELKALNQLVGQITRQINKRERQQHEQRSTA